MTTVLCLLTISPINPTTLLTENKSGTLHLYCWPYSCYFLSLSSKYSPELPNLKYPPYLYYSLRVTNKVSPLYIGTFVARIKVKILGKKCLHKSISLFYYRGHVNGYVSEWPHRQWDSELHCSNDPFRWLSNIWMLF